MTNTSSERKKKRPSLYLNPPLERVSDKLGDNQSLSARLATIVERYELICAQAPELTTVEQDLIGNTLSGSLVNPLLIKHLDDEILESDAGDASALRDLATRVRDMSYAERIAMIEALGF